MSLYLQRLLDRSAGLAARDNAALQPAVHSQSPILAFDQRLGDPELAADFGLLGASPDEPPPIDEPLPGLEPAERARRDRAPAAARAKTASRSAPAPTPTPVPEADAVEAPPSIPPPAQARPLKAAAVPRREPEIEARPHREPRIDLPKAIAEAPSEALVEPPPRARKRAARPAEPILRPTALRAAPPDAPPRSQTAPIREKGPPPAKAELRPPPEPALRPAPAPPVPDAAIAAPRPADPPAPVAEPIVAIPEAVPPPQHLRRQDIDTLVREAVRAETARQRPAPAPPAPARQPALEAAPEAPGRRPATAAEASVIGPLQRSSFNPMLFGVRRR